MEAYDLIAEFYDLEHDELTDDVFLYGNLVQDGPVLEVGAGTGRILAPLAEGGLVVWGVEPSAGMLGRAQARIAGLPNAQVVPALSDLPEGLRFPWAVCGLNTLWHASTLGAQTHMLEDIRARMAPDGHLIVDTLNPITMADRDSSGELRLVFRGRVGESVVDRLSAAWDDPGDQMVRLELTYVVTARDGGVRRTTARLTLRYLYRWELELLLQACGFEIRAVYGSYDLEPFAASSPRIVVECRAR